MNTERWLVSYADFITLLFAFFVVLFASSQVDSRRIEQISAAFDSYVSGRAKRPAKQTAPAPPAAGPDVSRGLTMAELQPAREKVAQALREEVASGKIEISLEARGLVVSLKESAVFAPGDDMVSPGATPMLAKVADAIRDVPGQVRLEGHTDDRPIRSRKFPSNWQLSMARSVAVLKLLTKEYGLPAARLVVAGYGEHHPLDSNRTEKGRTRNRRVDVVILTQAAAAMAPL